MNQVYLQNGGERMLNIKVKFFEGSIIEALEGGIYQINMQVKNDQSEEKEKVLYIGQSYCRLIRGATHLYKLCRKPEYFGFTDEMLQDNKITLKFSCLDFPTNMKMVNQGDRRRAETKYVKTNHPLLQNGWGDRIRKDKNKAVKDFYENLK